MADVKVDIEEALAAASKEETSEEESSTEEASTEAEAKADAEAPKKGKGAQDRIRELVSQQKSIEEKLEKASGTLSERDAEIKQLLDLVQAREEDSRVVKRINELYQEAEYKPYIEYLDKLVKGEKVEEVPEFSTKKAQKGTEESAKLLKELSNTKSELASALADQKADVILDKADSLTDRWLGELPKEYTDEDKKVLQELLVNRIDWDAIEESGGKNLNEKLKDGFQKTLTHYGKPKGLVEKTESKEKEKLSPEDEQLALRKFIDQDWGALEEKQVNGKSMKVAKVSDEDFSQALANLLKRNNQLNR